MRRDAKQKGVPEGERWASATKGEERGSLLSLALALGGFRPQSFGHPILIPLYSLLWQGPMNYLSETV